MMKVLKRITTVIITVVIFFFFLSFSIKSVLAENLLIVEVQIAEEKSSDDFIKIYNPSNEDLNITGYKLRKRVSSGGESSIRVFPQGSKIPAKGYFLWANSKNDFHLTVGATVWSTATLAKNNSIALLGPENIIINALAWGESQNPFVEGSPFPENPLENQQLKRKRLNGNYQDTNNNSQDFDLYPPFELSQTKTETLPEEKTRPESQLESSTGSEPIIYPSAIVINEVLPSPEGSDETEEWIEIFNQNNFEVDLSGWKIEDAAGRTTTYTFPEGRKIGPLGFLVLYRVTTKITLNNEGDGLNLLQPDGKIIDTVNYEKAPRGQSYNRTPSGWLWSTSLTPGSENIILVQEKEETEEETKNTSTKVKSSQIIDINTVSVKELQKIVGIGPGLAQKIIEARPFYSLDELTKVSGIGQKTLEEIKKQGLAWVDPELERPKIEKTESPEKGLAAAAEPFKQGSLGKEIPKFLTVFLIALIIAIFSGIIILVLKRKIKTGQSL